MVDAVEKEIKNKKAGERFGLDEEWNMKKCINMSKRQTTGRKQRPTIGETMYDLLVINTFF